MNGRVAKRGRRIEVMLLRRLGMLLPVGTRAERRRVQAAGIKRVRSREWLHPTRGMRRFKR
jgi:hypothetical protein